MAVPNTDGLSYVISEAGPVDSSNVLSFLEKIPKFASPSSFFLDFKVEEGAIPETSGKLEVDEDKKMFLKEANIPPLYLEHALKGGKLESLNFRFPSFHGGEEDFERAGEVFETLKGYIGPIREAGYDLSLSSFKMGHYMVNGTNTGFLSVAYSAKVMLDTEEMIKGQDERKLVLKYTHDTESSPEVKAYLKFLKEMNSR